MIRYYTRACNFYYGKESELLVNKKKTIPLNGNKRLSFDNIEIITRSSKKKLHIKKINSLKKLLKKQIILDIEKIRLKKKNFANLNFLKIPNIMGVLNLTPDSFSDGGKFNKNNKGPKHAMEMFKAGANIIDVGGESTRPGSKPVGNQIEWKRIKGLIKSINKKIPISLDTRKSDIMKKGIKYGVKIINDVSGLNYDKETINVLKKYNIPFVVQHSQGTPENMQNKPYYKNELLDIYDFFEKKNKIFKINWYKT
jgi:dihydropteroate synthase